MKRLCHWMASMQDDVGMMDWLAQRAARSPERVALLFAGQQWTWRELDARVMGVTRELARLGIGKHDRVAVLMRNSDSYVALVHAIARRGAVLVPLNTRLTVAELVFQVDRVHGRTLLFDVVNAVKSDEVAREMGGLRVVSCEKGRLADGAPGSGERLSVGGEESEVESASQSGDGDAAGRYLKVDEAHSILFTSGTTGKPKGAVLTYGNHWWNAIGSALNLGLRDDDVWLACMPLFHVGGLAILLRSVIYGIPVVLHESFDAVAVNSAIDEQRATIVSLVSTMLERVLDARKEPFPPWLRCVLLGGGPAPRELLERCARWNVPVVQTYGLTEAASQVATLPPEEALRKPRSAGKALMGIELRIDHAEPDEEGKNVGEIVIQGPTIFREYVEDAEATARVLREGWFHTGDLGYLDKEGFLYVVARRDDLIVSGGENIYPAEIEAVLNAHPAVQEAAVIGVADARWVGVPVAFVVLRAGQQVKADELKRYCAGRLARYKIPAQFIFVEQFPRNAVGKLLRRELVHELKVHF